MLGLSSPVSDIFQFEADANAASLCSVLTIMLGDLMDGSGAPAFTLQLSIELTAPSLGVRVQPTTVQLEAAGQFSNFQVECLQPLFHQLHTGSCTAVGLQGCCTSGLCLGLPPNCYCDEVCHTFEDCCPDIFDINCAGE